MKAHDYLPTPLLPELGRFMWSPINDLPVKWEVEVMTEKKKRLIPFKTKLIVLKKL